MMMHRFFAFMFVLFATIPNQEVQAQAQSGIVAVYYNSQAELYINTPGISFTNYVLFPDGSVCRDCFNLWVKNPAGIASHRRSNPDDFGQWTKKGNIHYLKFPGIAESFKFNAAADVFKPLPKGTMLNAKLKNAAGSDSDLYPEYFEFLLLKPDGRFQMINDGVVAQGRYDIDGYAINFTFANGKVRRFSLARDVSDPHFLMIDGTGFYTPPL